MPYIVTRLLDAIDGSDNFDAILHARLVGTLTASDPHSLTLRERFRSIAHLQRAMMYQAARGHGLIPAAKDTSSGRHDHTHLDESLFPGEVAALMSLSGTLRYSDGFRDWIAQRRQALIHDLDSDPEFMIRILDWQHSDAETRLSFLREFTAKIIRAHSNAGFTLNAPKLMIDSAAENSAACTFFDTATNRHIVRFGKRFMEGANEFGAMTLTYHETLHVVTSCMGIAAGAGRMDPEHPFYPDACLRQMQDETHATPWREIQSYYRDDFEESLAYASQRLFIEELFTAIDSASGQSLSAAPLRC